MLPFFGRLSCSPDHLAARDDARCVTYRALVAEADTLAARLDPNGSGLAGARVAIWVPPSVDWAVALVAIWRAGGVAVPLALSHPEPELEHVLSDSGATVLIADPTLRPALDGLANRLALKPVELGGAGDTQRPAIPGPRPADAALLVYTSGTTGPPKGVVLTHDNLHASMEALEAAWGWTSADRILEVLPLHHVHGIVNVVLGALWAGAECRFLPRFDAERVWELFCEDRPTLFMAVPTIYSRLLGAWEGAGAAARDRRSQAARRLRLMVSGSAALPVPLLERWSELTGHTLLERYGMTEIGMALSNPLDGPRIAGSVGQPLPGVAIRLVDPDQRPVEDGEPGEIEVRGRSVFRAYWNRPDETAVAFRDGWFRTGDIAMREAGVYRLLGRAGLDILKSGGEKISAVEIEATLRAHPAIADCAVVGLADPEWGQRVAVAVEPRLGGGPSLDALRAWAKERLATAKIPRQLLVVDQLPRNALGKVMKTAVRQLFEEGDVG